MTGDGAHIGHLLGNAGHGGGPDPHHQRAGRSGGPGHGILHPPFGVVAEAEQTRPLLTQLHDPGDDRIGVIGVAIVAAVDEFAPDLFAQGPVIGEAQEGVDARAGVDDGPALDIARPCSGGGRGLVRGRQSRHAGFGRDHCPRVLVGDHLLPEAGEGVGQGRVDPAQLRLAGGVQGRAVADEAVATACGDPRLFGGQARGGGPVSDRLDAGEQFFVEGDLVTGGRQQGRQFGIEGIVVV